MNLTRITSDTYLNLDTVATIKLNGFKPGTSPVLANSRTLVITFSGGAVMEFKAVIADKVVDSLRASGIDLQPS